MLYKFFLTYPTIYLGYLLQASISDNATVFAMLDKYGFPTAALVVVLGFLLNRQKKTDADAKASKEQADKERNDLIAHNNELTVQLIATVERGNQCMYKIEHAQEK